MAFYIPLLEVDPLVLNCALLGALINKQEKTQWNIPLKYFTLSNATRFLTSMWNYWPLNFQL